jgi:hypothetical protein
MESKTKVKATLTEEQRKAVGALLVDILAGEIRDETRRKLLEVERTGIPEPYHHLTGYTLGSGMDGRKLAKDLLEELRIICVELQEDMK